MPQPTPQSVNPLTALFDHIAKTRAMMEEEQARKMGIPVVKLPPDARFEDQPSLAWRAFEQLRNLFRNEPTDISLPPPWKQ